MPEPGLDFNYFPNWSSPAIGRCGKRPGKKGIGSCNAPGKMDFMDGMQDGLVGGKIDPEWFFSQQMLAGMDRLGVDLLVLVVRHGNIYCFD